MEEVDGVGSQAVDGGLTFRDCIVGVDARGGVMSSSSILMFEAGSGTSKSR